MTVRPDNWGVHRTHCCVYHGCKYGDEDCPVATKKITQWYPCESCAEGPADHQIDTFRISPASLQKEVEETFTKAFGRTPLRQRIEDIFKEALELSRYTDMRNLEEETGDLLASLVALMNEQGWKMEHLLYNCLSKIQTRVAQYQSLGRKYTVAILGGAFDPITTGHIKIAQFVLDTSRTFDEVWIMPCFQHLYNKKMASPEHRLKMCELAARSDPRIRVFPYEIDHKLAGETYHFVKTLLEEDFAKHQHDFSMIIGMDNANTFDKWVNYQDLERMIRFVVVPRGNVERDEKVDWYLKPPHIYLHPDEPLLETSSTHLRFILSSSRRPVRKEEPGLLEGEIDPLVLDYIIQHKLYTERPE